MSEETPHLMRNNGMLIKREECREIKKFNKMEKLETGHG